MRTAGVLTLLFAFPGATLAAGLEDPLPIRDPLPLKLLFLDQTPAGAPIQPAGEARLSVFTSYVNTMIATDDLVSLYDKDGTAYGGMVTLGVLEMVAEAQPSRTAYILDGETLRTSLQTRFGVSSRFEIGAEIPFLSHGRGFLDSVIDSFHERLDLPDGGRTGFAHNQFRAGYIGDGERIYLDRAPSGVRLGDIVLSATGLALRERSGTPGVSASIAAKLPTGDFRELAGSGSFDFGVALRVSKAWGRVVLHGGFAYNSLGEWRLAPAVPIRNSRSLFGTCAFTVTPDTSLILQVLRTAGPFPYRSGNDLGKVAMEAAVGFRHRLRGGFDFEWSLIENIDPFYNTPDVGTFLGLNYRTAAPPSASANHAAAPPRRNSSNPF